MAWFNGRSEAGPRALGSRSILADPRKAGLVEFINSSVKHRESFRPFAPSVLAEEAQSWFEGITCENCSPYMSITTSVRQEKRSQIPAVTHIDGTSRLQTVDKLDSPLYYKLIRTFFELTGVPMVLNTSFNTLKGEPIVETPGDALKSFLGSLGSIEMLVMGSYIIRRKKASLPELLGEKKKAGIITAPKQPVTSGPFVYESSCAYNENDGVEPTLSIRVRMPDRPMHNDGDGGGWFQLTDELEAELLGFCDGSLSVENMLQEYLPEDISNVDQALFENIVNRLARLFEHTLISW